jgi:hypothetical protein
MRATISGGEVRRWFTFGGTDIQPNNSIMPCPQISLAYVDSMLTRLLSLRLVKGGLDLAGEDVASEDVSVALEHWALLLVG